MQALGKNTSNLWSKKLSWTKSESSLDRGSLAKAGRMATVPKQASGPGGLPASRGKGAGRVSCGNDGSREKKSNLLRNKEELRVGQSHFCCC